MEANGDRQPLNEISLNSEEARDMSKDSMTKEERERHNIKLRREYRWQCDNVIFSYKIRKLSNSLSENCTTTFRRVKKPLLRVEKDQPAWLESSPIKPRSCILRWDDMKKQKLNCNSFDFDFRSLTPLKLYSMPKLSRICLELWDERQKLFLPT